MADVCDSAAHVGQKNPTLSPLNCSNVLFPKFNHGHKVCSWHLCGFHVRWGSPIEKKTTVWQRQEPESDVVSVALEAVVATNNGYEMVAESCRVYWFKEQKTKVIF